MNALIPAFVAILLAEAGGPLSIFGRERRVPAALAMLLLLASAAVGGWYVAAMLNTLALTLLLGLALLFAGAAQFSQRAALTDKPTIIASAITLYRSPTPFLVFAFAAWLNAPVSAALGAIGGVAVVAALGSMEPIIPRAVRIAAGVTLCLAGTFAALSGLRLV